MAQLLTVVGDIMTLVDTFKLIGEQLGKVSNARLKEYATYFNDLKENIEAGKFKGGKETQWGQLEKKLKVIEDLLLRYNNGIRHNRRHNEWQRLQVMCDAQNDAGGYFAAKIMNTDCMPQRANPTLNPNHNPDPM